MPKPHNSVAGRVLQAIIAREAGWLGEKVPLAIVTDSLSSASLHLAPQAS